MSFLYPWAFWIAALVVPALLILYFLKLRRREELVPSTLLWKRAVQDLQVNAPFQRLRKNLLLFLQLLVLAAAIFALARPIVQTTAAAEGRLVILIDRSASMNAREGDRTRLALAQEQAVRLVKTLNRRSGSWLSFLKLGGAEERTQAMVIAFSDRASVVAPFTPNTADLVDVIERLEPTDGQTNIAEALELAEAYMAPPTRITGQMESTPLPAESAAKLVLISDGAVADLDQVVLRESAIELLKIGQTRDNAGITTLRVQRNYERPELVEAFLEVRNFGDEPVTLDVSLYLDGELADAPVRTITLAAAQEEAVQRGRADQPGPEFAPLGSAQGLSFELALERAAVLEARLSREDALAADNRAYAVVPPPRRLRVLVVTEKNFFLDSVLRGLALQERVFLTPAQYEAAPPGEIEADGRSVFDVVLFDKHGTSRLPVGNYLFIGAVPQIAGVEMVERLEKTHPVVWWDETHPVLRHVKLDYVYADKDLVLKLPKAAETLIEGPRGPLLARYARDGRQYLLLAFAIENSTWWQKTSFVAFAYNAIRYLGSGGAEIEAAPTRPGNTLRIQLPERVRAARLIRPDGSGVPIKPDSSGVVYYGGTQNIGIYRVSYAGSAANQAVASGPGDSYAVNLEDPWESDIRPRGADEFDPTRIKPGQLIETATPEIWRWFIGAALVVVLLEWYIYNRRVMI